MTPKTLTSTALMLIMAVSAQSTFAQSNDTTASGSDDSSTGQQMQQADSSDMMQSDDATASASGQTETPGSRERPMMSQGAMVVDLQSLSEDIYERGYRQGYLRGVQEARQDLAMQMRYLAKERQMMDAYQNSEVGEIADESSNPDTASVSNGGSHMSMSNDSSAGSDVSRNATSEEFDLNRISNMVGARPGGSIVILPQGVAPERFIERLAQQRGQWGTNWQSADDGGSGQ